MLDQPETMTNTLCAQQQSINKILIDCGAKPVCLSGMEIEVNVLWYLKQLINEVVKRLAQVFLSHQIKACQEIGILFLESEDIFIIDCIKICTAFKGILP